MQDGFIKVAAASPPVSVADCAHNAQQIIICAEQAAEAGVRLLVTPELGITGSTCGDLFLQQRLQQDALRALQVLCEGTKQLGMALVVGLPLRHRGKLYNCAAVLCQGRVLGLVPKANLSNHGEACQPRQFTPAFAGIDRVEAGPLRGVPIGMPLLFRCEQLPGFAFAVEIGEDLSVPMPPSIFHATAGAAVIVNLAASHEAADRAEWRRRLVAAQSARLHSGYVYAGAGAGESSSDLVFAGHGMVAENGVLLDEAAPFSGAMAVSEIDTERLLYDRQRNSTFPDSGGEGYLAIGFSLPVGATSLSRTVNPLPFVPQNAETLSMRCGNILSIQAAGLQKRLEHVGAKTALVGISGGLDSSLALLVMARAFAAMNRPANEILAVTMPGFGTTARTKNNAETLCRALGVSLETIDITAATRAHFADIGQDEGNHDVVYENAQARMRTMVLMDLANQRNGLVVGTGDLSELALGWATYNGDHMSMYGVNASVPKTLIRHLIAYEATVKPELAEVLKDILDTPVSPELLPPEKGAISQQTEQIVGPYELHDFFLYYLLRWGFAPGKVLRLAEHAFAGRYSRQEMLSWMQVFCRRFFSQQYKRNCLPDGPKVGSVSLSPRGDWQMPSDASAAGWLREVEALQ